MSNKKLMKKVLIFSLSATMVFSVGSFVYANTSALPNGTIANQNGIKYLTDSKGEKYSGWFIDSKEDWYYFNETDKAMKTGWYHDDKDGYWYYLNLSDGKMVTGWKIIDGKDYFFQPVRDMGNYHFNNEQEKWYYSINSKVPYGAMYVNTTTPDGSKVNEAGAKITSAENIMKDGWISKDEKWLYFEKGALEKDKWLNLDGKWYFVTSDGSMVNDGWKDINGKPYYFGSDGIMFSNAVTPDGKKVGVDGTITVNVNYNSYIGIYESNDSNVKWTDRPSIIKITQLEDKYIYGYFEIPGTNDDGTYFNFKAELNNVGEFIYTYTREHNINPNADDYGGRWVYKFHLSENNNRKVVVLKEVTDLENNSSVVYDVTYYATQDIARATTVENGWISKDGKWYYYENGTMAKDKWLNSSGKWYYITSDGSMVSNSWRDINEKSYYFGSDGAMYVSRITPDGKQVDGQGVLKEEDYIKYVGRYVDEFTLGHGSDRGKRIEIEKIEDGRIWASVYMHDYGSSATTLKGKLEGVKLVNGIASGIYKIAYFDVSKEKVVSDTHTFQIKLKNPSECSSFTFGQGTEYELEAFSSISMGGEDFYFYNDEWDKDDNVPTWFMESEDDLF